MLSLSVNEFRCRTHRSDSCASTPSTTTSNSEFGSSLAFGRAGRQEPSLDLANLTHDGTANAKRHTFTFAECISRFGKYAVATPESLALLFINASGCGH